MRIGEEGGGQAKFFGELINGHSLKLQTSFFLVNLTRANWFLAKKLLFFGQKNASICLLPNYFLRVV